MKNVYGVVPHGSGSRQNVFSFLMQAQTSLDESQRIRCSSEVTQKYDQLLPEIQGAGWCVTSTYGAASDQGVVNFSNLLFLLESSESFSAGKRLLGSQVQSLAECYFQSFEVLRSEVKILEETTQSLFDFPVFDVSQVGFSSPRTIIFDQIKGLIKKPLRKSPLKSLSHFVALLDSVRRFEVWFYSSLFLTSSCGGASVMKFPFTGNQDVDFAEIAKFAESGPSGPVIVCSFAQLILLQAAFRGEEPKEIYYMPRMLLGAKNEKNAARWVVSASGIEEVISS